MTDKMEVDNMEVVPASSSGTVSASSSSSEKLDLTELGLDELNGKMKHGCRGFSIEMAEADTSLWPWLISNVLVILAEELAASKMKDTFIASLTHSGADVIVNGLDDKGLEELKAGVRDGVEKNDWSALIAHRTYIWIIGCLDLV
jgi:hypothetical protein